MHAASTFRLASTALLTIAAGAGAGCDDSPIEPLPPAPGAIRVTIVAPYGPPATDYPVRVDDEPIGVVGADGTILVSRLPGVHVVEVDPLECLIGGENPRSIEVIEDSTAGTTFEVECRGTLRVATATTGANLDDAFEILVDNQPLGAIGPNDLGDILFPASFPPVELSGVAPNCHVTSENPISALIAAGAMTEARFDVSCAENTGNLRVNVHLLDSPVLPYTFSVDGGPPAALPFEGERIVWNLSAGLHTLLVSSLRGCSFIVYNAVRSGDEVQVMIRDRETTGIALEFDC